MKKPFLRLFHFPSLERSVRSAPPNKRIVLKGEPQNGKITFFAIAQQLIVDWGDDSEPEIYTNIKNNIAHTYSNNTTYTIQIKEKELGVFYYNRHSKGHITSMDVSGCTALEYLNCGYNLQLTSLSISRCPALEFLDCQSNQLTSLYISECPSLKYLDCSGNQLADSVLNAISSALPSHSKMNVGWLKIYNNPGINGCDRTIAKNKGWWIDFTL